MMSMTKQHSKNFFSSRAPSFLIRRQIREKCKVSIHKQMLVLLTPLKSILASDPSVKAESWRLCIVIIYNHVKFWCTVDNYIYHGTRLSAGSLPDL